MSTKNQLDAVSFVNLTPHVIRIADEDGNILREIEPSGRLARVETKYDHWYDIPTTKVPIMTCEFGDLELPVEPEEVPISLFLVSLLVLNAAKEKGHYLAKHLVAPDTGPTCVRKDGQPFAVRRLVALKVE